MSLLFLDLETTGLDHNKHGVVQIASIPSIDGERRSHFNSYLKPRPNLVIDDAALSVNGLSKTQIQSFKPEDEVLNEFVKYLYSFNTKFKLVGYNVQFDKNFLYSAFTRNHLYGEYKELFMDGSIDLLEKTKRFYPEIKKYNLTNVLKFFNIDIEKAHDALSDISATFKLYDILKVKMQSQDAYKKEESYWDIKRKVVNFTNLQIGKDGTIYISPLITKNKDALLIAIQEIWDLYGDD